MAENTKVVKTSGRKKPPRAGMGRPKGTPNKTTKLLKDAILKAAEAAGDAIKDDKGKETKAGMISYLKEQAVKNPGPFMALLGKVLPLQIANDGDDVFKVSLIERVIRKAK